MQVGVEDFSSVFTAVSDITPYVIEGLRSYAGGQKVKFVTDINSTICSKDINVVLEQIYQMLKINKLYLDSRALTISADSRYTCHQ